MSHGLFRRVYLHGLLLLAIVAISIAVIGLLFGRPKAWNQYSGRLAAELSARSGEILGDGSALARDLERDREWMGLEISVYDLANSLRVTNVRPPVAPVRPAEIERLPVEPSLLGLHRRGVAIPIVANGRRVGYAMVRMGRLAPHLLHGALVLTFILAVLALVSIPLARQIASPLERLTRAVERFGRGDLSARAGIDRKDEVGDLAKAFDEMAGRLETLVRGEKELLANVSHELRTPLSRVRVALELASEGDEAKVRSCLGEIATDLEELERLVGDVLTAARLDLAKGRAGSASTPLRLETVASKDLVEQSAARFRAEHPIRTLEATIEGELPELQADPVLLRRAIDNLLDNARKYSDENRPVSLVARAADGTLVVEVRDRGIGIAPEDQAKLFTPFFRADESRARGTGGVGLGLVLARRIVEAHGGTIAVESRAGEGTAVRIRIPGAASRMASA